MCRGGPAITPTQPSPIEGEDYCFAADFANEPL